MEEVNNVLISKDMCRISYRNITEKRPAYGTKSEKKIYEYSGKNNCKVYSHYGLFHQVMNYLQDIGFRVGKDPRIEKGYKLLSKDHRYGRKENLEFKAERYPSGFSIQFYQNVVIKNPNGGEYDFDKLKLMPYLIKLEMFNTMNKLKEWFSEKGIAVTEEKKFKMSYEFIRNDYVESCHHPQNDMNFSLSDLDGTYEKYNSQDRDKKVIRDGDIKYYRGFDGRLRRGKVYHNIGNMWWVILNKFEVDNIADFQLFDASCEDFEVRRQKRKAIPKEFEEKKKIISTMSNKELIRELKRRQKRKAIPKEFEEKKKIISTMSNKELIRELKRRQVSV